MSEKFSFDKIDCVKKNKIKSIEEINNELYSIIDKYLSN